MARRSPWAFVVFAVVAALLGCFFFWPLFESLRGAFLTPSGEFTLAYFALLLDNPTYVEGFRNALAVAAAATIVASVVGTSLAIALDRWTFPGKALLSALVPLPLIVPPFVGALGVKQVLGQTGALNALLIAVGAVDAAHPIDWLRQARFLTVVLLTALYLYPVVYFNVSAALTQVNPEMEEAAENLGTTGLRRIFKITLPLILPSLFAAITIVFIWALTELGVPLMCDYTRITSVQIFSGANDIGRSPLVYALVVTLLSITTALYIFAKVTFGKTAHAVATKSSARRTSKELGPLAGGVCAMLIGCLVFSAALPNVAVLLLAVSGDWYGTILPSSFTLAHVETALGHGLVVPSIANSLRYVTMSTAFDIVLGVGIAHIAVRSRMRLGYLLDAAAMLPLAVPGLVLAFGYLAIAREGRPLSFLNPSRDPTVLLVVAYAIRRLPFVVRAAAAGLQQVSVTLEEAAENLGASDWRVFWRVTFPLLGPHLVAGGVFAFALSMLEVSDSLILAQRQTTYPVTKAIYELSQLLGDGRWVAAALGAWAMIFLGAAVAFARSALGRRFGGLFRV
ncbi:MAG TPA: iron ABC transporter permease [Polyangiaceae bacterium]|nr:iron ABC transporter permease [Polyangiaceae bacterium]